jgi:rare lipoprotein A
VTSSRLSLLALSGSITLFSVGCAAKRQVSAAPPAQPSPAPNSTSENAKNSTNVSPARHAKTPPVPAPVGYTEEGHASWYGNPFHGRRASNGEVYDMYKLTAAHRTLPFETMVRVTNLNIDLSLAAAREIDSVGPGVVPVRLEVIGNIDLAALTEGFFTVQVGAFRDRTNAERLRGRLSVTYSPIFIQQYDSPDGAFYRLRVGKVSGEDAAKELAAQLRDKEGFTTLVFRLDDVKPAGVN